MEIEISGKKILLKELKYLDIVELSNFTDKKEHAIKLLELSGIDKETTNSLSVSDGTKVMNAINQLNGFGQDFQKTSIDEKKN